MKCVWGPQMLGFHQCRVECLYVEREPGKTMYATQGESEYRGRGERMARCRVLLATDRASSYAKAFGFEGSECVVSKAQQQAHGRKGAVRFEVRWERRRRTANKRGNGLRQKEGQQNIRKECKMTLKPISYVSTKVRTRARVCGRRRRARHP